jgi:hypothetical protein
MEKEFVTYEQALALKELGFNEECFGYYVITTLLITTDNVYDSKEIPVIKAPLKQQVFRWFREKYKIRFIIQSSMSDLGEYFKLIFPNGETRSVAYPTYPEAENACIDKLIELAKQQHHD